MVTMMTSAWTSLVLSLVLIVILLVQDSLATGRVVNAVVCNKYWLNATCRAGHVVLMKTALYGRMAREPCLESDSHIGCSASVLPQLDQRCSGRRRCSVRVPDEELQGRSTCPGDVLGYLDASYTCLPVAGPPGAVCSAHHIQIKNLTTGHIGNVIAHEQGTNRCLYRITMATGQKINITLLDFGVSARSSQAGNMCYVYARIRESGSDSSPTSINVCGSRDREKLEYSSQTNQLDIELLTPRTEAGPIFFLLKFVAVGCPSPVVPAGAWVRRVDNKATIECNSSRQTWHIVCDGNTWHGPIDNCSSNGKPQGNFQGEAENFPYGSLLIAVITGIILGILIGVAMLAIVFCVQRRRKHQGEDCDQSHEHRTMTLVSRDNSFSQKSLPTDPRYNYAHMWTRHADHTQTSTPRSGYVTPEFTIDKHAPQEPDINKDLKAKAASPVKANTGNKESSLVGSDGVKVPAYEDYEPGNVTHYDVADAQICRHFHRQQSYSAAPPRFTNN